MFPPTSSIPPIASVRSISAPSPPHPLAQERYYAQLEDAQRELAEAQQALQSARQKRIEAREAAEQVALEAEIAAAEAAAEAAEAAKPRVPAAIAAAARLPQGKSKRQMEQEAAAKAHRERLSALRGAETLDRRERERAEQQFAEVERAAARRVSMAQEAEREAARRTEEAAARDAARRARTAQNLNPNAPVTSNERASKDRFGLWTRKRNYAAKHLQARPAPPRAPPPSP